MRTIGNIERFLVVGIVVVIGVILAVAINGARDVRGEYDKRVAEAKSNAAGKNAPPIKRDGTATHGAPPKADQGPAAEAPRSATTTHPPSVAPNNGATPVASAGTPTVDAGVKKAMDERKAALDGKPLVAGEKGGSGDRPADRPAPGPTPSTDESSKVKPPVEMPDAPHPVVDPISPTPTPSATRTYWYTVQKGDTLERIARALYGDGKLWSEIHVANPSLTDAHSIRVGDTLKLPKEPTTANANVVAKDVGASGELHHGASGATLADHSNDGATPKSDAKNETKAAAATSGFKRVTSSDQYKVQKGDTLMSIALANYGTKGAWKLILDANADQIADKDRLKVGTTLKLPAD